MENIYVEEIINRYKQPVNYGNLKEFDVSVHDTNPICGDNIEIQIKFNGGKVDEIKFQGQGCAISQASVDILIDLVKNKSVEDVKKITIDGFLRTLGIELSSMRLKCALLGLKTLKTAVYSYMSKQM